MTRSKVSLSDHQIRELHAFHRALLNERSLLPIQVFLFGSTARGGALPFSDVDVAVISAAFEGVSWAERLKRLTKLHAFASPIAAIGVTEEEMKRGLDAYPTILRSLAFRVPIKDVPGYRRG